MQHYKLPSNMLLCTQCGTLLQMRLLSSSLLTALSLHATRAASMPLLRLPLYTHEAKARRLAFTAE